MIIIIGILVVYYIFFSMGNHTKGLEPLKTQITNPLCKLIMIAPIIGIVIFSILFNTVLTGRFLERGSHALLIFTLWMYGTYFYTYILNYRTNKKCLMWSIFGMLLSVSLAILLTPLNRYCMLIYSSIDKYSWILGILLLLMFYYSIFIQKRQRKKKNEL